MKTPDIEKLNGEFGIHTGNQHLEFKVGPGDIPVISIESDLASALVSLQGAHVLAWNPRGEAPVIWLSEDAKFAPGKSVRGGIPICWPWFGAHSENAAFPAHGFARTVLWAVTATECLPGGEIQITFQLDTRQLEVALQQMWPQATVAEYRLTIGKSLHIELVTSNHSEMPVTIGQALHTYFQVSDVSQIQVYGLENKPYLDKTDGFNVKTQTGPVSINDEVDRIYLQTANDVIIDDKTRNIVIRKQNSFSTVVWNPWQAVAEKMGDLGEDGYLRMLCVESANAAEDTVEISPGENFCLSVTYSVED